MRPGVHSGVYIFHNCVIALLFKRALNTLRSIYKTWAVVAQRQRVCPTPPQTAYPSQVTVDGLKTSPTSPVAYAHTQIQTALQLLSDNTLRPCCVFLYCLRRFQYIASPLLVSTTIALSALQVPGKVVFKDKRGRKTCGRKTRKNRNAEFYSVLRACGMEKVIS